ncbi:MAG: FHA domain-containing protein [Leptospiraceae bacterium]|nr:FHA domain-containing protein [Leptospiraceae bacterium]MCK6379647.1 FHA domain-containing protein [Leptospiraceae bacterium]NUM40101.1 FHA domain-containing protein [Leptospiraceae bacterium]
MVHFLSDPWIVLPTGVFILFVNFAILYFLRGYKLESNFFGKSIDPTNESSIYEKMYGDKIMRPISSLPYSDANLQPNSIENPQRDFSEIEEKNPIDLAGEAYKKSVLIQKEGPNPGRQYAIHLKETSIGRSEANDLVLWDNSLNPFHAKIKNIKDKFILFDLVSDKGVYVNGKKVLKPKILTDFDEIRIGKSTLIFRGK